MAGEGQGAGAVAVLNREICVLRGPTAGIRGFWPGKYEADFLRAQIGSGVFADLVGLGDIIIETE